ncbi:hypothetical protein D9M69_612340 [compost metagenome]
MDVTGTFRHIGAFLKLHKDLGIIGGSAAARDHIVVDPGVVFPDVGGVVFYQRALGQQVFGVAHGLVGLGKRSAQRRFNVNEELRFLRFREDSDTDHSDQQQAAGKEGHRHCQCFEGVQQ